jgi:hypothetical protein
MNDLPTASRARCLAVGLVTTAGALATIAWAAPDVRATREAATFDQLVVGVAATALTGCALWAWLVTGLVVVQALTGRSGAKMPGVPRRLRAVVLVACGVAIAAPGAAAHADDVPGPDQREVLAGLPPPERVAGAVLAERGSAIRRAPVHVVRPGDTLWDIAAADLGGRADPAGVTDHWQAIHALNASVIGADPDLIRPGQRLRMPGPPKSR